MTGIREKQRFGGYAASPVLNRHGHVGAPAQRLPVWCAVLATLALLLSPGTSAAQEVHFGTDPGPYYVGWPVQVTFVFKDVDSKVNVDCRLKDAPPNGITVQGPEVESSSTSFGLNINGRKSSHQSTDYVYRFNVTADREGKFTIGPFLVIANGQKREFEGAEFEFGKLSDDSDMQVSVSLPGPTVYVGQDVPVKIRWSFTGEPRVVEHAFAKLQIRSPLFDQFPFRDQQRQSRTALLITTAKGTVAVDAKVTQEQIDGRSFVVLTGTRTMVADTPGTFQDIPVTCRTQRITGWQRNFFGDLSPVSVAPALAAGEPVSLTVKPIPQSGRPPSFSGAVGRGFSVEASANRSVVRVGDPISLNITIRGDGDLSRIALPPLDRNEGLAPDLFQLPSEPAPGQVAGNAKQFNVTVRVKDQSVGQIPALAFSWFDPYREQFDTALTSPIALQVMETQVVSASDVVAAQPAVGSNREQSQAPSGDATAGGAGSFVGADLAITTDTAQLLASDSLAASARSLTTILYGFGVVLVLGSILLRQRRRRDQTAISRKKRLKQLTHQLDRAGQLPARQAAESIAHLLRELLAEFDVKNRGPIDALIARCDNALYATHDTVGTDAAELAQRGRTCARRNGALSDLEDGPKRMSIRDPLQRPPLARWLAAALAAIVLVPGSLCAQAPQANRVETAIQQYAAAMDCAERDRRLSMFARAEQLFRQIIDGDEQHPPIRNAALYTNLGNAALQAERIGPAILAYRQALELAPQHAQARQNLIYARSLLPDWARYDQSQGLIGSLFFWRSLLSEAQIKVLAAACFLLTALLLAASILRTAGLAVPGRRAAGGLGRRGCLADAGARSGGATRYGCAPRNRGVFGRLGQRATTTLQALAQRHGDPFHPTARSLGRTATARRTHRLGAGCQYCTGAVVVRTLRVVLGATGPASAELPPDAACHY